MTATRLCLLVFAVWPLAGQNPLALDGIAHVAFRVADLPASREFYRKLGYEQAFEFSDAAGTTVSYMKVNDRQFIELYRRTDPAQPLGLLHICFDTRDIEGLHQEYAKRELKPTNTQKARAGNLLFTMLDPERQLLEYTQYMPGSLHSNVRGQYLGERRISQHLIRASAAVQDLGAEQAFYRDKLGFAARPDGAPVRLRIAGNSGEEVELELAGAKARIVLSVADLARTRKELRSRGIAARTSHDVVKVSDPDDVQLEFVALSSGSK